jgi:hypothetical protein
MGKVQFKAGAEFDILSGDELKRENEKMRSFFEELTRGQEAETITRAAGPFTTDATGGTSTLARGGSSVYRVPVGYDAFLTRISIDFEGSNASAPTSCDVRICADQVTPAALRLINNQVPSIWDGSKSHAPLFRGGQEVVVALIGGPASTSIYCTVQVVLTKRVRRVTADDLDGV